MGATILPSRTPALGFLCVPTARGPHVTPHLVAESAGRLWLVMPRRALSARVAAKAGEVALYLGGVDGGRSITGPAEVLDLLRPATLLRAPVAGALSALGLGSYGRRHAGELASSVGQALSGQLSHAAFTPRVLASVRPDQMTEVGGWAPGHAVVGLETAGRVVALPARWDPGREVAHLAAADLEAVGATGRGRVGVVVDTSTGRGVGRKEGVLHRGEGRAAWDGDQVEIAVDLERTTWWQSAASGTVVIGGESG